MNEKVIQTVELNKILKRLTEECETPLGKKEAEELLPMTDREDIEQAQSETADALARVYRFGSLSLSGARDVRESLLRLKIQANLSMPELLNISVLLKTALRVKAYGTRNDAEALTDSLTESFALLEPLSPFQKEIERCILSEEEMADDASPGLFSIRRKIRAAEAKVRSELNALVISSGSYLRENVITMRNGRFCLPVKTEHRAQIPGMIHDESGSGSTVFIEPLSVVKLNNEIRELEIDETKEIEKILAVLSAEAETHQFEIGQNLKILSHLDFVFAKASLAREMKASRPVFNKDRRIVLKQARHPLLDPKTVVPIDVTLGDGFTALIITGPNTGGKTVSLKTVGLLSLMGQCGLHIPAYELSELGIFSEVFADIGDEQSIEQSLSTFSSHMKNIIQIIRTANSESLILFDELCAGTDPEEGAALAISILDTLRKRDARIIATTHYSELKLYALSTEGVENASSEFDVATLSPTYRLLIGIPGKSNAFAISRRLGLNEMVIQAAKEHISRDETTFEDVIKDLHDSKRKLDREKSEIGRLKAEAKRLQSSLDESNRKLEEQKERILSKAREEARDLLAEAKVQVDETIRELNRQGKDVRELEKVRTKTREMLEKTAGAPKDERPEDHAPSLTAKDLHVGDGVLVRSMNLKGTVSTLPDSKGNLFVQMGIIRSQVNIRDLTLLDEETVSLGGKNVKISTSGAGLMKAATISPEINLIGLTVDQAIPELDKYLDDAYLAHLPQVRIVHGRGTGALRQAVQKKCKSTPTIKEFRSGEFGEGDTGVTIAVFR
ncbi:MAG: endonuclease MutS2 [Lachnospiraceae bacterium]|nr:endonuclease MutS2 [Lachnospiraceae bacterium]